MTKFEKFSDGSDLGVYHRRFGNLLLCRTRTVLAYQRRCGSLHHMCRMGRDFHGGHHR